MTRLIYAMTAAAIATAALGAPAAATAENAMKVCGAKYQAAKTAKTLPAGQTWNQFLAQCRGSMTPAAASASTMAVKPAAAVRPMAAAKPAGAPRVPGQQSAAMMAMHNRQRQCGQQWSAAKAAGKVPAGQTWPQYWSQCNTRLKS